MKKEVLGKSNKELGRRTMAKLWFTFCVFIFMTADTCVVLIFVINVKTKKNMSTR